MSLDFNSLNGLLKLSSKQEMISLCQTAFQHRKENPSKWPGDIVQVTSQKLELSQSETQTVLSTLSHVIKAAIFQGATDPAQIQALFPNDFHKNLRDLLTKIFIDRMDTWRSDAVKSQVSLPRLVDMNWRVDTKTASDAVARMQVPTAILNLQIAGRVGVGAAGGQDDAVGEGTEEVTVELSGETLSAALDGLTRIRDQLASVAAR